MKKVVLVLMMLVTSLTFAQETKKEVTKSLEETIQPYVEKLLDGAEKGITWTTEQIPEVIYQYVLYHSVIYGIILLICLIIPFVGRRIAIAFTCKTSAEEPEGYNSRNSYGSYTVYYTKVAKNKWVRRINNDLTFEFAIFNVVRWAGIIIPFIVFLCNISNFVKATFFPKLFLVEKFIELI